MRNLILSYILGMVSTFIIVKILSVVDKTPVIKVPKTFKTITIKDDLVGYFDSDSIFHLTILDNNLIKFRWNALEQDIPPDSTLIQIDFTEENTVYLKPININ